MDPSNLVPIMTYQIALGWTLWLSRPLQIGMNPDIPALKLE